MAVEVRTWGAEWSGLKADQGALAVAVGDAAGLATRKENGIQQWAESAAVHRTWPSPWWWETCLPVGRVHAAGHGVVEGEVASAGSLEPQ